MGVSQSPELQAQRVAQRPNTSLAGGVAAVERGVDEAGHRGDSQQVPSLLLDEGRGSLERAPDTVEVDVDRAFPGRWLGRGQGSDDVADAGAGDDDIEATEVLGGFARRDLQAVEVADVDLPPARDAGAAETLGLLGDGVAVKIQQDEVGFARAQRLGQGTAESARGTSDRDGASADVVLHRVVPFRDAVVVPAEPAVTGTWVVKNSIWSATTCSNCSPT